MQLRWWYGIEIVGYRMCWFYIFIGVYRLDGDDEVFQNFNDFSLYLKFFEVYVLQLKMLECYGFGEINVGFVFLCSFVFIIYYFCNLIMYVVFCVYVFVEN